MSIRCTIVSIALFSLAFAACSGEPPPPGTLIAAAEAYDLAAVEAALAAGADPDEKSGNGGTSLHFAAGGGELEMIELLIDDGANPDAKDDRGLTPLLAAIATGKTEAALLLIDQGANVDLGTGKSTPLSFAAGKSNKAVVEALIDEDAAFPDLDEGGVHPVAATYKPNDLDMFRLLFEADRRQLKGSQLMSDMLSTVVMDGRADWLEVILDGGVDPDRLDSDGFVPLYHAAYDGNVGIVRALLEADAEVDAASGDYGSPVFAAVRSKQGTRAQVLELLLEEDPELEERVDGSTPLLIAALNRDYRSVELLIDAGAEVDVRTPDGGSALKFAAGDVRLVALLREHGAED